MYVVNQRLFYHCPTLNVAEMRQWNHWVRGKGGRGRKRRRGVRERLLKSNSRDSEARCFAPKKELTGSKSVSGEPTESNHSQCCDISLQRTWRTRLLFTRPSTLCKTLRARMINEKLTTSWPGKSTSSNTWQWGMADNALCGNYFGHSVANIFPRVIMTSYIVDTLHKQA